MSFLDLWKRIKKIGEYLYKFQSIVLFIMMLSITILVTIQVILRYYLYHPLMGIEELLLFPMIWLFFLGSANASWERTQIRAKVFDVFLKSTKSKRILNIIMAFISFGISCWITYWSYFYFLHSIKVKKLSATLFIPLVYAECTIFFGFLIMTMYVLIELIDYIIDFSKELDSSKKSHVEIRG